jgi:cytochrome c oxidase cbb3-type subunit II
MWQFHKPFEKHTLLLTIGILLVVSIGGIVQIAPLFYLESTIEKVQGVRPYSPLELAGRKVYVREGCYVCHSQMIRPLRDEVERYGHYSLAAESMYDRPFQWGSKRSGPDLARVGGKYSDDWHREHLINPRALVPESIMPPYKFLMSKELKDDTIVGEMNANKLLGVPYTDDQIAKAKVHLAAQADPNSDASIEVAETYPKAQVRDFDGQPDKLTEMDALIAYLQVLGTMVDFKDYQADTPENRR